MQSRKQHWETVFTSKASNEVSWFQEYPNTSIAFLELFNLPLTANIIDIGGGDCNLVDTLLDKGYNNIWVLDISAAALERAKNRLGEKAGLVHWIVSDITEFEPPVQFDFWHDRAAFHFLTSDEAISKYVAIAEAGIRNKGYLVLGTFSETGPEKCSGLQVQQYNEASMSARFEIAFDRIKCITEDHTTPFNTVQNFLFCSFQKK
ncbi:MULTISPECIES: class I SAM-dependent methyltransferase [Hydrotalea]|uniref:class I SAM-dependent methyltransferase n=1 Tax=Hydrotalea TaxID=1004300 RepID=UPI000829A2A1|nr:MULTISPECIES: class I SAM-dependent methyltransferase [Hydrotalea]RTL53344.1 MAG: class I SAM-dependent methyltransferase [Sphingobacteriales bacterium]RWZ84904.1 MAG: class I SAM-dependent methyltransferase [Hydrotalea sp. AMD]